LHPALAAAAVVLCRFCAKGSLYGLLHSPGCYLSWVQVVAMLLDAARGMEHLHANSVLHRWVGSLKREHMQLLTSLATLQRLHACVGVFCLLYCGLLSCRDRMDRRTDPTAVLQSGLSSFLCFDTQLGHMCQRFVMASFSWHQQVCG
jgi:hypothetical protein